MNGRLSDRLADPFDRPSNDVTLYQRTFGGLFAMSGAVNLVITQFCGWPRNGETIRWLMVNGGFALLAAAVLVFVRRPWGWWLAVMALATAIGIHASVFGLFLGSSDPYMMNPVAPVAGLTFLLVIARLFVGLAAISGNVAFAGLLGLLTPGIRAYFRPLHATPRRKLL